VRIVAGAWRGRALVAPAGAATRPTADRVRQALFDMLLHAPWGGRELLEGASVLDAFAGTGALGLEALSRGAGTALFVDDGSEARALLRANIEALALGGVTRIWRADATKLGRAPAGPPFTLAFLDPPYDRALTGPALAQLALGGWLSTDALVVVEEAAKAEIVAVDAFEALERRDYGDTQIALFRFRSATGGAS